MYVQYVPVNHTNEPAHTLFSHVNIVLWYVHGAPCMYYSYISNMVRAHTKPTEQNISYGTCTYHSSRLSFSLFIWEQEGVTGKLYQTKDLILNHANREQNYAGKGPAHTTSQLHVLA